MPGLRVPRHAAKFAETKTKLFPCRNSGGVFVHAGGQADGVGKLQTEEFNGQFRRTIHLIQQAADELAAAGAAQKFERVVMRTFGVLPE